MPTPLTAIKSQGLSIFLSQRSGFRLGDEGCLNYSEAATNGYLIRFYNVLLWSERPQFGGRSHPIPVIIVVFLPTYSRVRQAKSHPKSSASEGGRAEEASNRKRAISETSTRLSKTLAKFSNLISLSSFLRNLLPLTSATRSTKTPPTSSSGEEKQSPRLVAAARFDLPSSQRVHRLRSPDVRVFIVQGRCTMQEFFDWQWIKNTCHTTEVIYVLSALRLVHQPVQLHLHMEECIMFWTNSIAVLHTILASNNYQTPPASTAIHEITI